MQDLYGMPVHFICVYADVCPVTSLLFGEQAAPINIIVCSSYYCLPYCPHSVCIPPYPYRGKNTAMQATIIHHYIPIQYSGIYMPSEPFYAYWVLGNYNTYYAAYCCLSEKKEVNRHVSKLFWNTLRCLYQSRWFFTLGWHQHAFLR